MIIVCPYDKIEIAAAQYEPEFAVSVLDAHDQPPAIPGVCANNHLHLPIGIAEAEMTKHAIDAETGRLQKLLDFTAALPKPSRVLVHCRLGLCRSPAVAFIMMCLQNPHMKESDLANWLRERGAFFDPSPMMIDRADELMDRDGRMVDAIDNIGMGETAFAGEITAFPDWQKAS